MDVWRCNNCGTVNEYRLNICGKCNKNWYDEEKMYQCPDCGTVNSSSAERCGNPNCSKYFGSSGGCFPGNALVLTSNGPRRIDTFERGDLVVSLNTKTNTFNYQIITKIVCHKSERITNVTFENKRNLLRTTAQHSVLARRGWIKVGKLGAGDVLTTVTDISRGGAVVLDVSLTKEVEPVYNYYNGGAQLYR